MPYDIIIGRNPHDRKLFGEKGLIFLGKSFVKMGQYTSLSNNMLMDVAKSHVVLIAGKRGSGKSYTLGVMAEEISNLPKEVSQNISTLIFDTMGIYWTMKFNNEKDKQLLREWGLKPKKLPVEVFVPSGHYSDYLERGIPADKKFAIDITELGSEDWLLLFGIEFTSPIAVLIERVIMQLKKRGKYLLKDIISEIKKDRISSKETKNAGISLFESADSWGIFSNKKTESTKIEDLIIPGTTSILDLSVYNSVGAFNVRALVINIVSRKLFNQRMAYRKKEEIESISKGLDYLTISSKKEKPLVWIFIDEAHEFLPLDGETIATNALVQLLREGRQPGISLVLATQQPGQIHKDVMTQSDIIIAHRVTSKQDLDALNYIMQTYMLESIRTHMNELPHLKGSALILDDNSERIYPMRVRPRFTWHGGEDPSAVGFKKRFS